MCSAWVISRLLRFYGLTIARNDSFFGRNVLFCADQLCCTVSDISQGLINNIINSHVQFTTVDVHPQTANLLSDLSSIRYGHNLSLANLSSVVFYDIICFICTSGYYNFIKSFQFFLVKFNGFFNLCTLCMTILVNNNNN